MKKILSLLVFSFIVSCSSTPKVEETPKSAEVLYNEAFDLLEKTSYKKSAETFEKVELEHPYSKWSTKAKIMGAYAYYSDKKYDDAIISLDRFIKFHPGNKDVAYAYYLKSICYYDQIASIEKGQGSTAQALVALQEVTLRFPDTAYAKDAKQKINLAYDHLAGKEMDVGRFYLGQGNYLSALNRFSVVVNQYQTTSHIEEALYRQVEVYTILGLNSEAGSARKVLDYNYPDSHWTQKAHSI